MEEPVGKSSAGMTEVKAANIRSARITGKQVSNKTRRENLRAQNQGKITLGNVWLAYEEATQDRPLYRTDKCLIKFFNYLFNKPIQNLSTSDIEQLKKRLELTPVQRSNQSNATLSPATITHLELDTTPG